MWESGVWVCVWCGRTGAWEEGRECGSVRVRRWCAGVAGVGVWECRSVRVGVR